MGAGRIGNPFLGNTITGQGENFLGNVIEFVFRAVFTVGTIFFVFQLVTGGVAWIQSAGDKAALEQARGKVIQAVIGLFVLMLSFAIVTLIEGIFNITLLNIDIAGLAVK